MKPEELFKIIAPIVADVLKMETVDVSPETTIKEKEEWIEVLSCLANETKKPVFGVFEKGATLERLLKNVSVSV